MLETEDEHLHVVIFDFDSPDIDLEQALKRSTLKNYHFIRKPGNYSRSIAIREAVASIKDSYAIIVTIDLHLDIGSRAINDIRKVIGERVLGSGWDFLRGWARLLTLSFRC